MPGRDFSKIKDKKQGLVNFDNLEKEKYAG